MNTNIYHLLDNYFEGKTSAEEEKMIRHYFAQQNLPDDLKEYAPLFHFLENESEALTVLKEIRHESDPSIRQRRSLRIYWTIASIAAILLIAVVLLTQPDKQSITQNGNYVWVDGRRMTDSITVRKYAELSLEKVKPENSIIDDQLSFVME